MKKYVSFSEGLFLLTALTILCSGCVTIGMLSGESSTKMVIRDTLLVEDQLVALGTSAQPLPGESGADRDSLIIVGNKYNYVLTSGGEKLSAIAGTLDPLYLRVDGDISLISENNNGQFSSSISLVYSKPKSMLSTQEQDALNNADATACRDGEKSYCLGIYVAGTFFPQAKNLANIKAQQHFKNTYQIKIYDRHYETETDSGVIVKRVVLLPVTVAVDVVTLPIQIIGAAAILGNI